MKASRSASTRRSCSALLLACALAGSCAPQVEVVLVRGNLEGRPTFVKFQIGQRGVDGVQEFGPFDPDAIPQEQFASVPPGVEFFIDVIGCKEADPALCIEPSSFTARGCTGFITIDPDAVNVIEIVVDNPVDGDERCPPAP